MRRWWAIAAGSLVALGTLVLVASARPMPSSSVQLLGSLTIAWQGDQARGCAAEGLCGVRGSLQMLPSGGSSGTPTPPIELVDGGSAARVTETSPGGATSTTCADVVPVDFVLGIRHARTGGLHAVLQAAPSIQLPSAGRCAGPTGSDLSALALPARKLGSHGYDLSGTTTFGAGPFTVTAISTVRAVFSRGGGGLGGLGGIWGIGGSSTRTVAVGPLTPGRSLPTRFQESAQVDYRIQGVGGALTATFAGLAPPLCNPLGACGASGTTSETFAATGVLSFFGSRTVKHRVGSRAALADLRAGRLTLSGSFQGIPIKETTTEAVAGPNGATCSDRRSGEMFSVQSNGTRRRTIELVLPGGAPNMFGNPSIDALRTRCPGPSAADVLGTSALASATLPASVLGARPLSLTFRGDGSFTGSAYTGTRGGSVVLSLVFEHASGGTNRAPVFPLPGPVP